MKLTAKITVLAIAMMAVGCRKPQSFSEVPYLEYRSHEKIVETSGGVPINEDVEVELYFTDGDGDLGLDESMTQPPFCDTCEYYFNLLVHIFYFENGEIIDTVPNHSRIKNLTPQGQNRVLEGKIIQKVSVITRPTDSLKMQFQLIDRALNKSEPALTPIIYFPL